MRRDTTSSVQSFADDILAEVAESEAFEKTAAERRPEFKTEAAQFLMKTAQELRGLAATDPEISYEDMDIFMEKMAGAENNLIKTLGQKPGHYSSFGVMDRLKKIKEKIGHGIDKVKDGRESGLSYRGMAKTVLRKAIGADR